MVKPHGGPEHNFENARQNVPTPPAPASIMPMSQLLVQVAQEGTTPSQATGHLHPQSFARRSVMTPAKVIPRTMIAQSNSPGLPLLVRQG